MVGRCLGCWWSVAGDSLRWLVGCGTVGASRVVIVGRPSGASGADGVVELFPPAELWDRPREPRSLSSVDPIRKVAPSGSGPDAEEAPSTSMAGEFLTVEKVALDPSQWISM